MLKKVKNLKKLEWRKRPCTSFNDDVSPSVIHWPSPLPLHPCQLLFLDELLSIKVGWIPDISSIDFKEAMLANENQFYEKVSW